MASTDPLLVRQTLRGQPEAYGLLVERYAGLVYALILEHVRQPDDVEDLVQETFCSAYQALPGLRRRSRFAPWLAQIARHTALRWLRQEQLRNRLAGESQDWQSPPVAAPDEGVERQEQAQAVWAALDRLPVEWRRLVVLHHLEGCSLREVARFLDHPVTTVQWRLFRAERQLGCELVQGLADEITSCPLDRQRLRRRVLASLPVGLAIHSGGQAASVGVLAWLADLASAVVSPAVLVVGGLGTAAVYLASTGLVDLVGGLQTGPADQEVGRSSQPGVRTVLAEWNTASRVPERVAIRHQVPPPPLAMEVPAAQAEEADLLALVAPFVAETDSWSAAGPLHAARGSGRVRGTDGDSSATRGSNPAGTLENRGRDATVVLPGGATMEFVWIEPGTFIMGSPETEEGRCVQKGPRHEVTISHGFWLGKYELTQGQWQAVMKSTPWLGQKYVQSNPNHPAVYICWDDAQRLCHTLNQAAGDSLYRLPTEAEWEYACRAGRKDLDGSFGDEGSKLGDYAWYAGNASDAGEQ